jgi:hypothetical protein
VKALATRDKLIATAAGTFAINKARFGGPRPKPEVPQT